MLALVEEVDGGHRTGELRDDEEQPHRSGDEQDHSALEPQEIVVRAGSGDGSAGRLPSPWRYPYKSSTVRGCRHSPDAQN